MKILKQIIFISTFLLVACSAQQVFADTFTINTAYGTTTFVANLVPSTSYLVGDSILTSGTGSTNDPYATMVNLTATVNGTATTIWSNTAINTSSTLAFNNIGLGAASTPGNFSASFTGSVFDNPPPPYTLTLTSGPCNGIYSIATLSGGTPGDNIVLRMDMSGMLQYNGVYATRWASLDITVPSVTGAYDSASSPAVIYPNSYSNGYSISGNIMPGALSFAMPASSVFINTTAVTNNSTSSMSSASLTLVSVNGVPVNGINTQLCVGNSQGGAGN